MITEAEKVICRLYLEDMDKNHTCNEYRLLMELLDKEPCEDAISRQLAIDTAIDAVDSWDGGCNKEREKIIREALEKLPSVEQRHIRCADCKHWINHHLCESLSRYGTFETKAEFFCGYAERRING